MTAWRKHVATGTINALTKIAAELGTYVIFVQADLNDSPAITLYRSLGTMKTVHHLDIELGQKYVSPLSTAWLAHRLGCHDYYR